MKNNSRLYNLLAAGSLTVLLLLTFVLFQNNRFGGEADAATTTSTETTVLPVVSSAPLVDTSVDTSVNSSAVVTDTQANTDQTLNTLQAQNKKLLQAVQIMQAREEQYQTQLNNASQALEKLQTQNSLQGYEAGTQTEKPEAAYEVEEHEEAGEDDHDG